MKVKQYNGVKLYDVTSEFHLKLVDVSIDSKGFTISPSKETVAQYEASPAWVEFLSNFCDPGYEHKETLEIWFYGCWHIAIESTQNRKQGRYKILVI